MKELLEALKKNVWIWLMLFIVGFCSGRGYTYLSIATDCEVLGMFRIGMHGVNCRISKVPA